MVALNQAGSAGPSDFFVSYVEVDQEWAEWISWVLEENGYRVVLQAWDLVPGSHWPALLDGWLHAGGRLIAVLSPAYLSSAMARTEWQATWVADPRGETRRLVPVRVDPCGPAGLLGGRAHIDLVGLPAEEARLRLLAGVRNAVEGRMKPALSPPFPRGRAPQDVEGAAPPFPGPPHEPVLAGSHPMVPSPDSEHGRRGVGLPVSGLPRPDRLFTGRDRDLERLVRAITTEGGRLCVVHGMAGMGKTALVCRAAALLAEHFPDGTIFLDLRGYSDSHDAFTPADVVDRVLSRLGVDGPGLSPHADERLALYHDLLADRRTLLVFDNARDAAQVRPLLPGGHDCAVVITTRQHLTALDDAYEMALDLLDLAEAVALFRAVVGPDRLAHEPDADPAVRRIVGHCGRLPLAIRIAACRHRARRLQTLADLDGELADALTVLAALDDGERSVAAVFRASLAGLPAEVERAFALLAVAPGADLDIDAAAALLARPRGTVTRLLRHLLDRHLLDEHVRGRFRFHDLIAVYARAHARVALTPDEADTALRRITDYYLRAVEVADTLITPGRYRVELDLVHRDAALPRLVGYDDARVWLATAEPNITETCLAAARVGFDVSCWQLAHALRGYYFLTKKWRPWIATHEAARTAAERLGDFKATAMIVNNLGLAHLERGFPELAAAHYQEAKELFSEAGDRHGENTARANIAWIFFGQEKYVEFLRETEAALDFYRQTGAERNEAITLRGVGLAEAQLGRFNDAINHLRRALDIFTRLDLRLDTAMALNGLGEAYQKSGDVVNALTAHQRALVASERCGSIFERARAHRGLGQLLATRGEFDTARSHWTHALDDYQQLGSPDATSVETLLADLPRPE